MNDDILNLLKERKKFKTRDPQKFSSVQKEMRRKIRTAKEAGLEIDAPKLKNYQRSTIYLINTKKIKEAAGIQNKRSYNIVDKNGNLIQNDAVNPKRWVEYIK